MQNGNHTNKVVTGAGDLRKQAYTYLRQGDYRQAIDSFRKLKDIEPPTCDDYNGAGIALSQAGDWRNAMSVFARAYTLKPDAPDICSNYLTVLLKNGKYQDALSVLKNKLSVVPYELGNVILHRFSESKEAHNKLAETNHLKNFQKFLGFLDIKADTGLVSSHIFANMLFPYFPWREKIFDNSSDEEINKWVNWRGLEQLPGLLSAGQGLILLHSHFTTGRLATLLLAKQGYTIHSLEYKDRLQEFGIKAAGNIQSIAVKPGKTFYLRQVYTAKKLLAEGKILKIAGDGDYGNSLVSVRFCGRDMEFRTGFAELMLLSKVPVVPVFCALNQTGQITVELFPPLAPGDESINRQDRIKSVVQQYAGILEQKWRNCPDYVTYQHIRKFVNRGFSLINKT